MFEDILNQISTLTPFWVYVSLFFFSFVENVFPPSPSDLVVLIGGSLIGTGVISFIPTLILTSVGSVIGFMVLFFIGSAVDKKIIQAKKLKYIPIDAIDKVEVWFRKFGYWVILANRFLPGTRAVISFFAGISNLNVKKTVILSTVSAFIWNAIILYLGYLFGDNVELIDSYISTYSNIVIAVTAVIVIGLIIKYYLGKRKEKNKIV